jgi:hypothetical protein
MPSAPPDSWTFILGSFCIVLSRKKEQVNNRLRALEVQTFTLRQAEIFPFAKRKEFAE